eukprot:m.97625 g.97625  ORF g.97625 m.97625 type:complete len:59 (+) comp13104_c0_seq2:751-927(+)
MLEPLEEEGFEAIVTTPNTETSKKKHSKTKRQSPHSEKYPHPSLSCWPSLVQQVVQVG